jgi:hypothetical protein
MPAALAGVDTGGVDGDGVPAQGWYRDAYGLHEDRWMSGGQPTNLVRDQGKESFDEPPWCGPPGPLLPAAVRPLAGNQAERRRVWRAWTVWPPALLTLGLVGWSLLQDMVAEMFNCFDSCEPMRWVGVSVAADIVTGAAAGWLLAAGLLKPTWRRGVTLASWGLFLVARLTLPLILALTT